MVEEPISPGALEVAQESTQPQIATEVDEDGVAAGHGIPNNSAVVVRLDLDGVRVEGQAELLLDDLAAEGFQSCEG